MRVRQKAQEKHTSSLSIQPVHGDSMITSTHRQPALSLFLSESIPIVGFFFLKLSAFSVKNLLYKFVIYHLLTLHFIFEEPDFENHEVKKRKKQNNEASCYQIFKTY